MLKPKDLPQADLLSNVITTIKAVAEGASTYKGITRALENSTDKKYDDRQGRYYRKAAEFLGMIEPNGTNNSVITKKGDKLISLPHNAQQIKLASAVISCKAMKVAFDFVKSNPKCSKKMIARHLQTHGISSSSLAERRTSTIMNWFCELGMVKEKKNKYTALWEPTHEGTVQSRIEQIEEENSIETTLDNLLKDFDESWDGSITKSTDGLQNFHVNLESRERASKAHQKLVKNMAKLLSQQGISPMSNRFIDLYAKFDDTEYIFEMKSCTKDNISAQIRRGISQLYEYQYRHKIQNASLWLVLESRPTKDSKWYLDYLVHDRGINVCWSDGNKSFLSPVECEQELEYLMKIN